MFIKVFVICLFIHFEIVSTFYIPELPAPKPGVWDVEWPFELETTTETQVNSEICNTNYYTLLTTDVELLSANWPQLSFERVECVVHFNAHLPDQQILVTFSGQLNYYNYHHIQRDTIEIYDGIVATRLAFLSNDVIEATYISNGPNLTISFHITHEHEFSIRFKPISSYGCEIVNKNKKLILSPSYPHSAYGKVNCETVIKVPENQLIVVELSFDLPTEGKCNSDYIELRERVDAENSKSLAKFCGDGQSDPILSSGPYMEFRINKSSKEEFKLSITYSFVNKSEDIYKEVFNDTACSDFSSTDDNSFATYELIHLPHIINYENDAFCQRLIIAPENHVIAFTISDYFFESSTNCIYDYLRFYDGDDMHSPVIKTICGRGESVSFATAGDQAMVVFKSDNTVTDRGASAHFYFVELNQNLSEISITNTTTDCQTECVLHFNQRKSYIDAFQNCHKNNAELMNSVTKEKQINWQTIMYKKKLYENNTYVWLGGMRKARYHYSFQWMTSSSTTDFNFQNWAPKEPKNQFGFDCVKMSTVSGLWFTADCNEELMSFCELGKAETFETEISEARFESDENLWKALYESQQANLQQLSASVNELSNKLENSIVKLQSDFRNNTELLKKQLKLRDLLISRMLGEIEALKSQNKTTELQTYSKTENIFQGNASKLEMWLANHESNDKIKAINEPTSHTGYYVALVVLFSLTLLAMHLFYQHKLKQREQKGLHNQDMLMNAVTDTL